jgi:predicted ATPase
MYTSLSIKNFRAFETLEIEGLKRVNLFTGRNNSGKTSVLEAVYLLEGEAPAARARQLFRNRGLAEAGIIHQTALDMPWATLFRNLAVDADIELIGRTATAEAVMELSTTPSRFEITTRFPHLNLGFRAQYRNILIGRRRATTGGDGDFVWVAEDGVRQTVPDEFALSPGSFLLSNSRRSQRELVVQFGPFEVQKKDVLVLAALQIVEPRLRGLSTILLGGAPVLHADLAGSDRRLPLAVVGDGMLRLLDIVFAILQNQEGAILIDEIENGFHYSVLPKVWELIHKLAKQYNVQVFAVTHSHECAVAAHEAAKIADYDYQYFRIEQKNGIGRAFPFDQEVMQTAIDVQLEFR